MARDEARVPVSQGDLSVNRRSSAVSRGNGVEVLSFSSPGGRVWERPPASSPLGGAFTHSLSRKEPLGSPWPPPRCDHRLTQPGSRPESSDMSSGGAGAPQRGRGGRGRLQRPVPLAPGAQPRAGPPVHRGHRPGRALRVPASAASTSAVHRDTGREGRPQFPRRASRQSQDQADQAPLAPLCPGVISVLLFVSGLSSSFELFVQITPNPLTFQVSFCRFNVSCQVFILDAGVSQTLAIGDPSQP